jgi:hypothetical protein
MVIKIIKLKNDFFNQNYGTNKQHGNKKLNSIFKKI